MLELWINRSITTYILTQSEGASFHCFVYFSDDTWVDDQILYSRDLNIWLGRDTEWLIYPKKKKKETQRLLSSFSFYLNYVLYLKRKVSVKTFFVHDLTMSPLWGDR